MQTSLKRSTIWFLPTWNVVPNFHKLGRHNFWRPECWITKRPSYFRQIAAFRKCWQQNNSHPHSQSWTCISINNVCFPAFYTFSKINVLNLNERKIAFSKKQKRKKKRKKEKKKGKEKRKEKTEEEKKRKRKKHTQNHNFLWSLEVPLGSQWTERFATHCSDWISTKGFYFGVTRLMLILNQRK